MANAAAILSGGVKMMNAYLAVREIAVDYGQSTHNKGQNARNRVLSNLSLPLAQGEIGCLLGASGCGKSTVLRAIAGFVAINAGQIELNQRRLAAEGLHTPAHTRSVGMVFQDYALFPHLSVADNIGFGLSDWSKTARAERVRYLLELTQLQDYARSYPHQLSGGQQQRVALARALAPKPQLLLLDEPFSNLDVALRVQLAHEVRALLKHEGTTALWVTHDQIEAFHVADQIGVMDGGAIVQWDTPYALYHAPKTREIAAFIGQSVLLTGRAIDAHTMALAEFGEYPSAKTLASGQQIQVLLRPDDVIHDDEAPIRAQIEDKHFHGANFIYHLRLRDGQRILAHVPSHHNHAVGESIGVRLDLNHLVVFD